MQSGRAIRKAQTLEREKEMELNTIMQALVKDIAEQLRPMVADMVKQELANTDGDAALGNIVASINLEKLAEHIGEAQLSYLAEHLSDTQLVTIGENVSAADVAGELTDSQLDDIAGNVCLEDLAGEFDTSKIMANIDMDEVIRDFFSNNTFAIRP